MSNQVTFPKGKQVNRSGERTRLTRQTTVTVIRSEPARDGKTRVFWKSHRGEANALV